LVISPSRADSSTRFRQLLQQAAFAGQLEATGTSAVRQHPDQLVVLRLNGRSVHGLSRHVSHWEILFPQARHPATWHGT